MTTKHTPGPWRLEIGTLTAYVEGGDGVKSTVTSVAICNAEDDNGAAIEVMEANARLIAAAPELLAALRAAVEQHNRYGFANDLSLARAAIAKVQP